VEIRLANQTLRLESKVRKNGFSLIYHRLGSADILVIKSDRERPLAVVETANQAQKATQFAHTNSLAKPAERKQPTNTQSH
jgi:hypothetical protein